MERHEEKIIVAATFSSDERHAPTTRKWVTGNLADDQEAASIPSCAALFCVSVTFANIARRSNISAAWLHEEVSAKPRVKPTSTSL
jgi:hypothetical protein